MLDKVPRGKKKKKKGQDHFVGKKRGIKRPGEKERESGHMLRPLDEAG